MAGQSPVGSSYGQNIQHAAISQGAAPGTTSIVAAAGAGLKIKVVSYVFTMGLLGTLQWKSNATPISGPLDIATTGGVVAPAGKHPYMETAPNEPLQITTTLGGANGHLSYVVEK